MDSCREAHSILGSRRGPSASLAKLAQSRGRTLTWGRQTIPGARIGWGHPLSGTREMWMAPFVGTFRRYLTSVLSRAATRPRRVGSVATNPIEAFRRGVCEAPMRLLFVPNPSELVLPANAHGARSDGDFRP